MNRNGRFFNLKPEIFRKVRVKNLKAVYFNNLPQKSSLLQSCGA